MKIVVFGANNIHIGKQSIRIQKAILLVAMKKIVTYKIYVSLYLSLDKHEILPISLDKIPQDTIHTMKKTRKTKLFGKMIGNTYRTRSLIGLDLFTQIVQQLTRKIHFNNRIQ